VVRTSPAMNAPPRSSNQAKYETTNPVVQRMLAGFFDGLREVVAPLAPVSVLDAGCGEGEAIDRLADLLPERVAAIDLEQRCVDQVRARHPGVEVSRGSVTDLPFEAGAFELVLCLEVIEHVPGPASAITELARVASRSVVVSVPHEPFFRIGSLLRGKHVSSLGNHPEHVNHFNRRTLRALLEPALDVIEIRSAFPWLIASCAVREPASDIVDAGRVLPE
jgi:SAM-dependent methyltransferase